MREKLMNVKRKVKLGLIKCGVMLGSIGTGLYVGMAQVMAGEKKGQTVDNYTVNDNIDPTQIKNKVLDFIFIILTIVGVGIAAMGLFKLVNSIREDRPEDLKAGVSDNYANYYALAIYEIEHMANTKIATVEDSKKAYQKIKSKYKM